MREMLYSEIANFHRIQNIPDDPDLAIAAGMRLCEELLEPLHATFGHVSIRSAFRSVKVNTYGAERQDKGYNCGKTDWNHSRHVWDRRDAERFMGATVCIVIPWFVPRYEAGTPWLAMAWWVHDHLPYSGHDVLCREGKELRVQSAVARESGSPYRGLFPAQGSPHQTWDGEPRRRSLCGISRVPGAQALLTEWSCLCPIEGPGPRPTGSPVPGRQRRAA